MCFEKMKESLRSSKFPVEPILPLETVLTRMTIISKMRKFNFFLDFLEKKSELLEIFFVFLDVIREFWCILFRY